MVSRGATIRPRVTARKRGSIAVMTKGTIFFALTLVMTTAASARQRTFYDSSGKVVGTSSTDSQGSTTIYDASGKVVGRESTSGGTTTVYDAGGRVVGRRQ
jgi:YD repeat-containing protein